MINKAYMKANNLKFGLLFLILLLFTCEKESTKVSIFYNQVGYAPEAVKQAFIEGKTNENGFRIINPSTLEEVFSGELFAEKEWPFSGTSVQVADFTDFMETGTFILLIGNIKKEINISDNVNFPLGISALKTFYLARLSEPILEEHAGIYNRKAGHPDAKVKIHASAASEKRPEGTIISSPGGWYDAGDYNKYIVNSSITVYTLFHAYDLFPDYYNSLNLNIPESNNQIPDIIDETLVNLRWMLTMQDPEDGGVYHKLTSLNFCGMIQPHEDDLERYVVSKSTAAALDFAAVAAKSYRTLSKFEKELPGLADSCLVAAKNAWKWAEKNPDVLYNNPEDVTTGAYDDDKIEDEKYWAANELYLSTKDESYLKNISYKKTYDAAHWSKVGLLGDFSWIENGNLSESDINFNKLEIVKKKLIKSADRYYKDFEDSAFNTSIDSFAWGSNSDVANQSMLFIHAYKVSGDKKYLSAAESNLNYILGANPLDKCFVTGYGVNNPKNVHDRRCSSDGIDEPLPGILVGGPTKQARGDCGEKKYNSSYPALSYLDLECSYATNETAINWNAPFAFMVNGIQALKSE